MSIEPLLSRQGIILKPLVLFGLNHADDRRTRSRLLSKIGLPSETKTSLIVASAVRRGFEVMCSSVTCEFLNEVSFNGLVVFDGGRMSSWEKSGVFLTPMTKG